MWPLVHFYTQVRASSYLSTEKLFVNKYKNLLILCLIFCNSLLINILSFITSHISLNKESFFISVTLNGFMTVVTLSWPVKF